MELQQRIDYQHDVWQVSERVFTPPLLELLTAKDRLIVLRYGEPPYQVVLGAPHQTKFRGGPICENRFDKHGRPDPRPGDDNTASIALVAFTRLQAQGIPCKVVIAAHATQHDPNKYAESPYCRAIFEEPSRLLWECHACGERRHCDLELSAGPNRLTPTLQFGERLADELGYQFCLGVQQTALSKEAIIFCPDGERYAGRLQLPAIKTVSLFEAEQRQIPALHIEAKPPFREAKGAPNTVSLPGLLLGRAIATAIQGQG